jgi:hypothetical protein
MAMNDIEAHEQGNAKAGFFHRETLDGARLVHPPEVEQVSNPPGSNPFVQVVKLAGAGDYPRRGDHVELPDLFLERHHRQQLIDASHAIALAKSRERMASRSIFSYIRSGLHGQRQLRR